MKYGREIGEKNRERKKKSLNRDGGWGKRNAERGYERIEG